MVLDYHSQALLALPQFFVIIKALKRTWVLLYISKSCQIIFCQLIVQGLTLPKIKSKSVDGFTALKQLLTLACLTNYLTTYSS